MGGVKIDDYGLKPSRIVPLTLGGIITLPAHVVTMTNHKYPAGNLVFAEHFLQHGFGLTFNPNSLQIHGPPVPTKGGVRI
jgi:hypothetical protein